MTTALLETVTVPAPDAEPPKRKRGRPPKVSTFTIREDDAMYTVVLDALRDDPDVAEEQLDEWVREDAAQNGLEWHGDLTALAERARSEIAAARKAIVDASIAESAELARTRRTRRKLAAKAEAETKACATCGNRSPTRAARRTARPVRIATKRRSEPTKSATEPGRSALTIAPTHFSPRSARTKLARAHAHHRNQRMGRRRRLRRSGRAEPGERGYEARDRADRARHRDAEDRLEVRTATEAHGAVRRAKRTSRRHA